MKQPDVTVVIPTRDRRASLHRALNALARQHFAASRFEVMVAVDGDADATASYLATLDLPYHLTVVGSLTARGAAAARNEGAAAAQGELLVFLDDDIEAEPGLVGAHVRAHHDGAHVTVGYLRPVLAGGQDGFFAAALRGWWEAMFETMRRAGHRYWFRDLLTGNCAISAALFERLGRFDADLLCHEDYEFGVRAIGAGAVMRFVEEAGGAHHESTTLRRAFERKREEGRADVAMLRKHPDLVPSLPLGTFDQYAMKVQRLLRRLVFERPQAGRLLASALTRSLPVLESGRFRGRWRRRLYDVLTYWYWQGVADRLPSSAHYAAFIDDCRARSAWAPMTLEVDLRNGLELVAAQIDRRRPHGLRVMFNGERVGEITPVPGAEGLTGQHMKASLAQELAGPLVAALGRTGVIPLDSTTGVATATGPLPSDTLRL